MLKLELFSQADFHQLINWIPDSSLALQWGGPAFTYPLTLEQLENYLKNANTDCKNWKSINWTIRK